MKIQPRRLITAGGTLVCALGIGYFMQSSVQPAPKPENVVLASAALVPSTNPATHERDDGPALQAPDLAVSSDAPAVELDELTLTSVTPKKPDTPAVASAPVVPTALDDTSEAMGDEVEMACDYVMSATTEDMAMVRLSLDAPCMKNERFTLHHNGIMITQATDELGKADFLMPALAENPVFIVAFKNGEGAVATAHVPTFKDYDRAVVQWRGMSGLQIHALEFGADYEMEGHVWSDAAADTVAGAGGTLTKLGLPAFEDALLAEVYTFPTGMMDREGDVALHVEAEVTQANCGRDIEAQSIQTDADGGLKTQDLVLAVPDCTAVGDFLVLKNLLNDLKIAAK